MNRAERPPTRRVGGVQRVQRVLATACVVGLALVVQALPAGAASVARPDPCGLAEVRADGLTVSVTDLGLNIGVGGEQQFDVVWDWDRAEAMSSTEAIVAAGLQDTVPPKGSISHTYPAAGTYTLELAIATADDRCQTFDIDAPTPPTGLLYKVTVPPSGEGAGAPTKSTEATGGPTAEEDVSTEAGREDAAEDCALSLPGEYRKGASPEIASLILDFVPVIGTVKGVIEAIGGCDMVTGQKFNDQEKAWNILFALLSIIPLGALLKVLSRSPKYMKYLEWLPKMLKSPEMRVREKVPPGWTATKPGKGRGVKWTNPDNPREHVRYSHGDRANPNPGQQAPYVAVQTPRGRMGQSGKAYPGDAAKEHWSDTHISPKDYPDWERWDAPGGR